MVGGGRMVLLPLLIIIVGLDPSVALATMKTGGLSSSFSLIKFHKHKQVNWVMWRTMTPWVVAGAFIGSYLVVIIDQDLFKKLIGISVLLSLIVLLTKRNKGKRDKQVLDTNIGIVPRFLSSIAGLLGALFGFKGVFMRYWYVSRGLTFIEATATNKATSLIANIVAVISFIVFGLVNWPFAVTMFVAGGLGSWFGAHIGMKVGNVWVERLFALVVAASVVKLFL